MSDLLHDYIQISDEYIKKYGSNTVVFIHWGSFYNCYDKIKLKNTHPTKKLTAFASASAYTSSMWTKGLVTQVAEALDMKIVAPNSKTDAESMGFPYYSIDSQLPMLMKNNINVVLYEQCGTNKLSNKINRKVTAVYTAGTFNYAINTPRISNYILCLYTTSWLTIDELNKLTFDYRMDSINLKLSIGVSLIDISTGHVIVYETHDKPDDLNFSIDEIYRLNSIYNPIEIIIYPVGNLTVGNLSTEFIDYITNRMDLQPIIIKIKTIDNNDILSKDYKKNLLLKVYKHLDFGLCNVYDYLNLNENNKHLLNSLILLLQYCYTQNENYIKTLNKPENLIDVSILNLHTNSIAQLGIYDELTNKSVFDYINNTCTNMGVRLLKRWLLQPSIIVEKIQYRYNRIEYFRKVSTQDLNILIELLKKLPDIEKLHLKICTNKLKIKEFDYLNSAYDVCCEILKLINLKEYEILVDKLLKFKEWYNEMINVEKLKTFDSYNHSIFHNHISQDLDLLENNLLKVDCYFNNLIKQLHIATGTGGTGTGGAGAHAGADAHSDLNVFKAKIKKVKPETDEDVVKDTFKFELMRDARNLYKIPISTFKYKQLLNVDKHYKLTVDDYEYTISDLKYDSTIGGKNNGYLQTPHCAEYNNVITNNWDNFKQTLDAEFITFQNKIYKSEFLPVLYELSNIFSELDVFISMAYTSIKYNYCKPTILADEGHAKVNVQDLRHLIIERLDSKTPYVPHSFELGTSNQKGMLIYGINSSGKSCCMKSLGIAIVMAQAGFYIPAKTFEYTPFHTIFTRILGNDNIYKHSSSFTVEMEELRAPLDRADEYSLVLGDELCHGTETMSAVSLVASSIYELSKRNVNFMFTSHLHELNNIEEIKSLNNVKQYHLLVKTVGDSFIYDRHLTPGSGDSSYGIQVAKALKINTNVIEMAESIRKRLMGMDEYILSTRKSRYNSKLYMDKCCICNDKSTETHHIIQQKEADANGFINHVHKDDFSNLIPLCESCHLKVHLHKLKIYGWKQSSHGIVLDYNYV